MVVSPFKWKGLRKVSSREAGLTRALFEFLPLTDARGQIDVAIRKTFMKHLGQEVLYFLDAVGEDKFGTFLDKLSDPSIIVVIGLKPIEKKAFIHIDHDLAYLIIDRLLGGSGSISSEKRPLTETEQGVLQYLIMQLMAEVHKLCGASPRVHFRFEKFAFTSKEIVNLASPEDILSVITFKFSCFDSSGFVRLIFPDAFTEAAFLDEGAHFDIKRRPDEAKYFLKQVERYGFIKTSLWAEGGRTTLSPVEIRDLEPGDVILLEESDLILKGKAVGGDAILRVGRGESGGIRSRIKKSGKKLVVEVKGGV